MDGAYIKDRAIEMMAAMTRKALERIHVPLEEIALFIPHQANLQIIRGVADSLNFPMDRVMVTIDRYGNTSAASIPTALKVAVDEGRIRRNQFLAMTAFGAGLNFCAAVMPLVGLPKK
jgi:3-oxoacyl-[acyl-carrier-protein] synthase-3